MTECCNTVQEISVQEAEDTNDGNDDVTEQSIEEEDVTDDDVESDEDVTEDGEEGMDTTV